MPGKRVNVQLPVAGNPLSDMLPVARAHVGCVMVPITGAEGVTGCILITKLLDVPEVQPSELVTVYVYAPGANPEMVVIIPVPLVVTPPGLRVSVQVPPEGKPFSTTLPVPTEQVGWVMVPITGAAGVTGCPLITTSVEEDDIQPPELVTV